MEATTSSSSSLLSLSTRPSPSPPSPPTHAKEPIARLSSSRSSSHAHSRISRNSNTSTSNNIRSPRASTFNNNLSASSISSQHIRSQSYSKNAPSPQLHHLQQHQSSVRRPSSLSPLSPPSSPSVSSSKQRPLSIPRTISSSSNLYLQTGNLRPIEKQQLQLQEQQQQQQPQQQVLSLLPSPLPPSLSFTSAMTPSSPIPLPSPSSSSSSTSHPLPSLSHPISPVSPSATPPSLPSLSPSSSLPSSSLSPTSALPTTPSKAPLTPQTDRHHHLHHLLDLSQPQPLQQQHHHHQSSINKLPFNTRGSSSTSHSNTSRPAGIEQGRYVQETIAAFSRLMMNTTPSFSNNNNNRPSNNSGSKSSAIMPLLTISTPSAVASTIIATSSSSMSPASSSSQLPSLSPSSSGSPTSSDISSSSLAFPAACPASPSSCAKTTATAKAQSARRESATGPERIGSRGTGGGANAGVATAGKQQPSFSFSQSNTTNTLPASIIPSAFMGMKKPLPPAVSTSHVVSSAGTGVGTRRVSAPAGSPSDLYPLVGRDVLLGYGSLSAAAALTTAAATVVGSGGNKTMITEAVGPPKLRPMSSMENVEFAWSPASLAIPACPTTTTTMAEADGRAVVSAASFTGVDATTTPAMSLDRHSSNPNKFSCPAGSGSHSSSDFIPANINNRRNRNESSNSTTSRSSIFQHRQNSDQDSRGGLSKPLPPVVAVGRVSLDQQSIHPLQMDPDLDTATEENTDAVAEAMEGRVTTMLTRDDDVGQGTSTTTTPTTTLPISDQVCESSSLSTPVSMGLANLSSSLNAAPAGLASGAHHSLVPVSSQQQPKEQEQQQQLQPQQVIRKKTSFAAKLRKVFNNSKSLPPTPQDHTPAHSSHAASMTNTAVTSTVSQQEQTQEDIISLVSGDDLYGSYGTRAATHADMVAFMDQQQQHRGSVSSASSADTDVQQHPRHHLHHHVNSTFRRGSSQSQSQTDTPSTSPEATPCGSPTDQSTLKAVMTEAPAAFATTPAAASVSESSLPTGPNDTNSEAHHHHHQHRLHPLSGSESSSSPSAQDVESTSSSTPATGTAHVVLPTNQTAADVASALQQPPSKTNPTRTVKKRLSFASISSFFSPRNGSNSGNSVTSQQEARAKQQRASSVPHVENPLVTVGRQIAGFQRRHSLNDLHDNKTATAAATNTATGISRVGVSPLEKDPKALPPTPGHGSSVSAGATTSSNPPVSSHIPTPPKPTKKLSLNIVFNKGLRKKKNSTTASKPESPLPAKPLRSALANRNNGNNLPGQTTTAQSPPKVHLVHRSASRRRSASIRSQGSAHRRHHRNSHHSSHYHHHHHHHHNAHQQTDPFARLAEANHALANLNRRSSQDQAALRHLQQHQIQEGGFSDEFEFCTSPSSMEAPAGGLPIPLDTQDLHFHHNNQSREDLPISPTGPGTDELNGSTSAMDTGSKLSDGTSQIRHDAHPITFNRSQYPQQRNPLSTLSPSSSCCSYLSSSSSDRVEGSSFRSASNDVESCSSSSRSSKQDPVSPETTATAAISTIGSAIDSSSSRRGSADHEPTTVFNPLLPASAARVSVNRIAMESQQKARSDNNASDTSSSDGSASGRGSSNGSRYGGGGSQGGMSNDSETLYDHYASTGSAAPSAAAVATAAALSLTLSAESASTMSNSSTEASSTTSSTASANSPTKKNLTIMNTVTEDVSEEESMMHAQLAYIQQQQQQYLVQQQQPYQHQQQQEHHQHHHHVHYLPHNPHQHLPSSHYHPSQNQPHSDNEPIPSQPHHHQPYYYPHPSHFPPRPPRQLQFSTKEPLIFPTWTPEQYDRTSDAYITASRLTPAMANKIKLELNQFKSQEMLVHEESRVYTHFFI